MKAKHLLAVGAAALTLSTALPAFAQDGETVSGTIEAVEKDGRIRIDGHQITVDQDTEIVDLVKRQVRPRELVAGVQVEIVYEHMSKGDHATRITANLMR